MNNEKNKTEITKKTYPQSVLIHHTLKLLNKGRPEFAKITKEQITQFLTAYETVITNLIKETISPETEVILKPFNGLQIKAVYVPEKMVMMYGEKRLAKARISTKAKLTKYFGYFTINEN